MPRLIALALGLAAAATWAASPTVGQDAPEIGRATWVLSEPEETSIANLRGEVILVEKWGVKCGPCLALIPHLVDLQADYGGRGLHIFAFEAQGHTPDEIKACMEERGGGSYPVAAGGGASYQTDGGIPHAWLIGVDGKVIWQGNPHDGNLDRLMKEELAKVRYPGLGRLEFSSDVSKVVKSFLKGDLGGAREAAEKIVADEKASAEAKEEAQHIIGKIQAKLDSRRSKAEAAVADRRYADALEIYSWIKGAFAKTEDGDAADELLKTWKKDKDIQREIEAAEALAGLLAQLKSASADAKVAALEKFAATKKYEGTKAAEEAAAAGR